MKLKMHKIPRFQRMNVHSKGRVKAKWRAPHGIDSKQRQKLKAYGAIPDIGYRTPTNQRYLHPSGMAEVLVSNASQLSNIDAKSTAVRFSSTLGKKKKTQLEKICRENKIKTVN